MNQQTATSKKKEITMPKFSEFKIKIKAGKEEFETYCSKPAKAKTITIGDFKGDDYFIDVGDIFNTKLAWTGKRDTSASEKEGAVAKFSKRYNNVSFLPSTEDTDK